VERSLDGVSSLNIKKKWNVQQKWTKKRRNLI
jgi:hypothetical protein